MNRHTTLSSRVLATLLLLVPCAAADTLIGRVVGPNGAGVAGVDIDVVKLSGGGNPHLTNDGTDANGFFTATLDSGVYQVLFYPPAPPATTLLTGVRNNVVVAGSANLGVITLSQGVSLAARVVDAGHLPVAGVKAVVFDAVAGANLPLKNNTTGAFGTLSLAVPTHALLLDLDPSAVVGRTLVPRRLDLAPTANTNLGDLVLLSGFTLSGTVRGTAGGPLGSVDIDVRDSLTGVKLYTPNDTTDVLGAFALVLPPGTFDVDVCPAFSRRLVAASTSGLVLAANLNVGVITLQNGVALTGTVRAANGTGYAGADVNVRDALTGASVALCGDNTGAAGAYGVIVPLGTMHVGFALPGKHGTSGEDLHLSVPIGGDTVLDGVLPAPAPDFSASPRSGTAPLSVAFSDLSTGAITAWAWDFGDGATSGLENPAHVYAANGSYAVALTLSGPGGPATKRELGYVVVGDAPPTVAFTGTPTSGVAPLTVSFTNQSSGNVTGHAWTFGDGASSSLASPAHTYLAPGTYTVSLTESGTGSSTLTKVDYIVVLPPAPVAEFTATPRRGRSLLPVAFQDLSTGAATSWSWDFGDGTSSNQRNPTHVYRSGGIYTVTLTVAGPGGSDEERKGGYVVVRGPRR